MKVIVLLQQLTLETLTDVWMLLGGGSAKSKFPFSSRLRAANGLAGISGGGPNISLPLSSLLFASEFSFFILASASLSRVPLSSRCLATSGNEDGFLGDTAPSALNDIWLMPVKVCCYQTIHDLERCHQNQFKKERKMPPKNNLGRVSALCRMLTTKTRRAKRYPLI